MNWDKITKDEKVKQLLIDRAYIEEEIKRLDENALIMYELEVLSIPDVVGRSEQLKCPCCGSEEVQIHQDCSTCDECKNLF